jgi:hypothetical protein
MTITSYKSAAAIDPLNRLSSIQANSSQTEFRTNDEFMQIDNFLPHSLLCSMQESLPQLEPYIHRSFIPKHKKGGSISRFDLAQNAPIFSSIYTSASLKSFLSSVVGKSLLYCPENDPHAYALYSYDREGDHIGFHYDKSYYRGSRYTCLIGLVDDSCCALEYELFSKDDCKETVMHSTKISPGSLVFFNGDNIRHRVTPAKPQDKRTILTLEYLTDSSISNFGHFYGQLKDAFAYFGVGKTLARLLKKPQ